MMYEPVIIIGAPRSGTNMLRDMLVQLSGVGTWPCDEINYIWRHGNLRYNSDEFLRKMATDDVQKYIRKQFHQLAKAQTIDTIIEKTCANSLRVDFVDKVIPEAKYIFIVRDGLDAVGSAIQRWTASLDMFYIMKKARYVPPSDFPYYATRYFFHRMHRLISKENRLALWGPAMADIDGLFEQYSLTEVCALQWKACVDKSADDFSRMPSEKVMKIKYEDFVKRPVEEFARLASFINKDVPSAINNYLMDNIKPNSVGKGRDFLGKECIDNLHPLIADTLNRYDYE